jgi:hypothetical protein
VLNIQDSSPSSTDTESTTSLNNPPLIALGPPPPSFAAPGTIGLVGGNQPTFWSSEEFGYGVRWWDGPDYQTEETKKALRATLTRLCACVHDLKRVHLEYLENYARRTRIGSL